MSKIDIGIQIDLETFLETKLLIEADSGSGKSWTIRKMAEECSGKVQQIIIDPEGDFITLREKYPFALVSKSGGDIPLNIRYAEALAHKLLETGISVIIDLYEFKQHEREQFVKVFCEALMDAPKSLRHSCLVYLDEAQLFCPEDKRAISTAAVIDVCTRGRKRGLCAILATLRISILNKSAAAQCKNKMMGSTSLPLDQKRVGDELGFRTKEEIRNLRNLGKGEFYAFGPAISKEIVKFKVGAVKTTHIKSGSKLVSPPPTPSAIKKILSKLEDIPEEAEKELATKKQYQDEIKRLNLELKGYKPAKQTTDPKTHEQLSQALSDLKNHKVLINALKKEGDSMRSLLAKIKNMAEDVPQVKIDPSVLRPVTVTPLRISRPFNAPVPKEARQNSSNGAITGGAMRMLKAAAMLHPQPITKSRMGILARLNTSSGSFSTYKATLKREGLIIENGDLFSLTEEGVARAGEVDPLPSDPDQLVEFWCNIIGSNSGSSRILRAVVGAYPNEVSKEQIGGDVGISHTSGSFSTYVATLRRNGLVTTTSQAIKASEELFN